MEEQQAAVTTAEQETELELSAHGTEMVVTSNLGVALPNLVFPVSRPLPQFISDQDLEMDSPITDVSMDTDSLTCP